MTDGQDGQPPEQGEAPQEQDRQPQEQEGHSQEGQYGQPGGYYVPPQRKVSIAACIVAGVAFFVFCLMQFTAGWAEDEARKSYGYADGYSGRLPDSFRNLGSVYKKAAKRQRVFAVFALFELLGLAVFLQVQIRRKVRGNPNTATMTTIMSIAIPVLVVLTFIVVRTGVFD